jgi:NAD(P)-dependent dehydrogenase (short-subunit alcohol dehydrogenase family)
MSKSDRVWFITGASSGFGRALAEAVISRGERAVVAARRWRNWLRSTAVACWQYHWMSQTPARARQP